MGSVVSQPPQVGELWVLDDSWNPPGIRFIGDRKIALVLKEMCLGSTDESDDFEKMVIYTTDPLVPIYRSLVEGHVVDLHWTWFKCRLSP